MRSNALECETLKLSELLCGYINTEKTKPWPVSLTQKDIIIGPTSCSSVALINNNRGNEMRYSAALDKQQTIQ